MKIWACSAVLENDGKIGSFCGLTQTENTELAEQQTIKYLCKIYSGWKIKFLVVSGNYFSDDSNQAITEKIYPLE